MITLKFRISRNKDNGSVVLEDVEIDGALEEMFFELLNGFNIVVGELDVFMYVTLWSIERVERVRQKHGCEEPTW